MQRAKKPVVQASPEEIHELSRQASELHQQQRFTEALAAFDKALILNPTI